MERERIGIMGGSFNPIHERHVEMAQCAMKEYKLDRVIFLPTGNPPHKHEELAEASHRYEMTRLAIFGLPGMEPSRMELEREGTIYTVDTLTLMKKRMGDAQLFYMIGEDTMVDLPNWRKPDKVFSLCQFIVCCRSTEEPKRHPVYEELLQRGAKLRFLSLPPRDVSSTAIRKALAAGEEPVGLSPAGDGIHPRDGPVRRSALPAGRCPNVRPAPQGADRQAAGTLSAGGMDGPPTGGKARSKPGTGGVGRAAARLCQVPAAEPAAGHCPGTPAFAGQGDPAKREHPSPATLARRWPKASTA